MKRAILAVFVASVLLVSLAGLALAAGGNGYNYKARVFVGSCTTWYMQKYNADLTAAQNYCGGYANDQLVMKWNAQWDNCNDAGNNDVSACLGAWENNEWNGAFPDGSGSVWHYKIIWSGQQWDLSGQWNLDFLIGGNHYLHTMTITSFDPATGDFSGTGYYNPDNGYTWTVTGNINGDHVTFTLVYTGNNAGYTLNAVGTLGSDGTLIDGTITASGSQTGTFTADGTATNGEYWLPGGYSIWGNYEVIMDQGIDPSIGPGHFWFAQATPNGYGAN